jgi:hypothetical protein
MDGCRYWGWFDVVVITLKLLLAVRLGTDMTDTGCPLYLHPHFHLRWQACSSDKPHQRFLEIGPLQVKHYRMSGLKKYQQRVLSRFFSLLLPPSPSSNGRLLHHHGETKSHG